ncbi:MAG: DUF748 domain-containing protein [Candidatus Latescibacteria bacterium]|nr:DUF748 domain-containing protein [Candidatus Latescibacterota bacterium]
MNANQPRIESGPRRPRLPRLLRDWRFWIVTVAAVYTIAGFLIVPLVAKHQIPIQVRRALGCEASVQKVRFNPYTFNAMVGGLVLQGRRGDTLTTCQEIHVNFSPWPLRKHILAFDEVRALSPTLAVRVREDNTMNLLDLVPDTTAVAAKEPSEPFLIRVDRLEISDLAATLDDATVNAHVAVDSVDVHMTSFFTQAGDTAQFTARLLSRAGGSVRAEGFAMPLDGVVHARLDIDSLAITPANPYLARYAYLEIKNGKVNLHGDVHAHTPPGGQPDVTFEGDFVADDLAMYDTLKKQDFFGFERLAILNAQAQSLPPGARIEEIGIEGIYARIAIAEDQGFNVNDVFAPARALADSVPAAPGAAPSEAAASAEPPVPDITIGRIRIDGGEVDFSDLSLPLPFATRVHSVKGEVTALSPDNAAGSKILVEGTVDEHGFAKATGYINAFDPIAFTDITVAFRNIELTDLTPYSGKFAGYRIKKGKLSLGLEYDIQNAQMKGDNEILLEKLTLGEKIESPDATNLPVKLAVALLKDSNGNIDLDLEVAGDLNDPKVNTASLIWQALKKVIIKVTTAPFRFLGNLIGIGGDEMEFVEFEPGRNNLTPPQHERLGNLAKALKERPALTLQVHGAYDKRADADAIRAQRFDAQLEERLLAAAGGDSSAVDAIKGDPSSGRMQAILEAMYTEAFGAEKLATLRTSHTQVPAAAPGATPTDPAAAAPSLNMASYMGAMRDELTAAQPVADGELVQLAASRSNAIRGYMIEMQTIAPERVVLSENDVHDDDEDWVRCKLGLDASE